MARKKKDPADVVSELLELAEKCKLPEGFFADDILDECVSDAKIQAENINNGTLMDQLEFLLDHGFHAGRLRELIVEAAK